MCGSALEVGKLVGLAVPRVGIGQGIAAHRDDRPRLGQLGVEGDEGALMLGYLVLGVDRLGRAFRDAQGAVDALVRIEDEEIRPFGETVHRADLDAVRVFALDAVLGDDVGHGVLPANETEMGRQIITQLLAPEA